MEVYDKYNGCSLYSTVKVLILSHISVWRLGLKISRSCPVLKYLVSIVNMIVKEQLKIERNCFIKMISIKLIVQEDGISSFQLLHAGRALRMIRLAKLLSLIRFSY